MTDQEFCDLYNAYYGHEGIDKMYKPEQLTFQRFKGRELKEFVEYCTQEPVERKGLVVWMVEVCWITMMIFFLILAFFR